MNKKTELELTICIPTYSRSNLLIDLVRNITNQKIDCSYEILIINDSDFDEQVSSCKELDQKYSQVRYIQNKNNLGLFKSLEENFGEIRGKYVIFLGDDDKPHEGLIDLEVKILNKHKNVCMVAPCFNLIYIKDNLTSVKNVKWHSEKGYRIFDGAEIAIDYLSDQSKVDNVYSIVWPSVMFRRSTLEKVDHFRNSTRIAFDTMLIGKVLAHGDFAQISAVLFDFINYGGALRELNSSNGTAFHERIEMLEKLEDYIKNCTDCSPIMKNYDFKLFKKSLAKHAFSLNGPAVWIASRHTGSYLQRLMSVIVIFTLSVKMYPQILLRGLTYIVLLSCLFLPSYIFFHAAKIYNLYKHDK
jgi:glycosyltransferase involved in cell wall biosynthesis